MGIRFIIRQLNTVMNFQKIIIFLFAQFLYRPKRII